MEIDSSTTEIRPPALEFHTAYAEAYDPSQQKFELASLRCDPPEELEGWVKTNQVPSRALDVDMSLSNIYHTSGKLYTILKSPHEIRVLEIKPGTADEPLQASLCSIEWFKADQVRSWALNKKIPISNIQDNSAQLYKPLVDPYEIRVLEIKPGTANEPLQASLHHCSIEFDDIHLPTGTGKSRYAVPIKYALSIQNLEKPVRYTALSYTWGPRVFEAEIECDGHVKRITRSLETALRHLRQTDRSVVMWIDQVCINQADTKEKEQQIPLMSKIYRRAQNTIVWLGEGSAGSDSAMCLLEDFNYRLQFSNSNISPTEFKQMCLPPPDSNDWKDVWDVLSRAWFTRVWIIQETILSGNLWVACGDTIVAWDSLATACTHLTTCGISRWLQGKFAPDGRKLNDQDDVCMRIYKLSIMESTRSSLFYLLVDTWPAQCDDHRDKIYGLLGICEDSDRKAIKLSYADDYTASMLFRDMAVHHLETAKNSTQLTSVLCSTEHCLDEMPSWVPDWRKPRQTSSLGYSTSTWNIYNACGHFKKPEPGQSAFDIKLDDQDKLCVRGILFDSLIEISDVFVDPDLSYHNPTIENKDLIASSDFALKLQKLNDDNTLFDVFWHTLVAGKDDTGRVQCPQSYAQVFSLLLDESTGRSPSLPGQTYSERQKRPKGKGRLELSNLSQRAPGKIFQEARTAMKAALRNRRLGITKKGHLGLFPLQSKDGDIISVLNGCHLPFLVRPAGNGMFRLVGECYVYGIMNGEAVSQYTSLPELVFI